MGDSDKIQKIQEHLENALSLIIKIQAEKNSKTNDDVFEIPKWAKDRLELWAKVYLEAEGNPIDKKRVDSLWVKMGKDKIGTAGFFTGKRASLQRTIDGRITLTQWAEKQTKEWTGISLKDYAKKFENNEVKKRE